MLVVYTLDHCVHYLLDHPIMQRVKQRVPKERNSLKVVRPIFVPFIQIINPKFVRRYL